MRSRGFWLFFSFALLACGVVKSMEEPAKPRTVTVAKPVEREVTDFEEMAGTTAPSRRVELKTRTTGYLTKVQFKEGEVVKKDDLLFEVDSQPYQNRLVQAVAQLKIQQAALQVAKITLERDEEVDKKSPGVISRNQLMLDRAEAELANARVKVAEAAVEGCQLDLSYCKVTAPMSGSIGRCLIDPGNLVLPQTHLATLIVTEPLHLNLDVDEKTFLQISRAWKSTTFKGVKATVAPIDGGDQSEEGVIDFVDNRIEIGSGTIRVRVALANKKGLMPGMTMRVRVPLGQPHNGILVSDKAIGSDLGIRYVYVVDAGNKLQFRRVTVGQLQLDGLREIVEGLKADERVVVEGIKELRPGLTVQPDLKEMPVEKPRKEAGFRLRRDPEEPLDAGPVLPSSRLQPSPGILVQAGFPGATAQQVSEAVRGPIEEQVSGFEKVRYLRSRCTSDGKFGLQVTLWPGVERDLAQVLVQNRVSLALPVIPSAVQEEGITVRRGTSGVAMMLNLVSDGRHDQHYLRNYSNIYLRDELARTSGIGAVSVVGGGDLERNKYVELDLIKLAARHVQAKDVVHKIREEKKVLGQGFWLEGLSGLVVKGGLPAPQAPVAPKPELPGLLDPDAFLPRLNPPAPAGVQGLGQDPRVGSSVRLEDVATIRYVRPNQNEAILNGKETVALILYLQEGANPKEVRASVNERLTLLRKYLADGVSLVPSFDFLSTGQEYLVLDLDLPVDSHDAGMEALRECDALVRKIPGIEKVMSLSENPFDAFGNRPCLLLQLTPAERRKTDRPELIRTIRRQVGSLEGLGVRVRDLTQEGNNRRFSYPLELALNGPETESVRKWATLLGKRLEESKKLTDVWTCKDSLPRPRISVEIDRELATGKWVSVEELARLVEVYSGVTSIPIPTELLPSKVYVGVRADNWLDQLMKLRVRSSAGEMFPISFFLKVRHVEVPLAQDFLDFRPMVQLTANPAPGESSDSAQKLCVELAEEIRKELGLPREYRLTWLTDVPVTRKKVD